MGIGRKALIAFIAIIAVDLGSKAAAVAIAGGADVGMITPRSNPEFALGIVPLDAHWAVIAALVSSSALVGLHTLLLVRSGRLSPVNGVMLPAGALANGVDRLATGAVHDFIDLAVVIANIADFAIVWGIIAYMVAAWRSAGQDNSKWLNSDSRSTIKPRSEPDLSSELRAPKSPLLSGRDSKQV